MKIKGAEILSKQEQVDIWNSVIEHYEQSKLLSDVKPSVNKSINFIAKENNINSRRILRWAENNPDLHRGYIKSHKKYSLERKIAACYIVKYLVENENYKVADAVLEASSELDIPDASIRDVNFKKEIFEVRPRLLYSKDALYDACCEIKDLMEKDGLNSAEAVKKISAKFEIPNDSIRSFNRKINVFEVSRKEKDFYPQEKTIAACEMARDLMEQGVSSKDAVLQASLSFSIPKDIMAAANHKRDIYPVKRRRKISLLEDYSVSEYVQIQK